MAEPAAGGDPIVISAVGAVSPVGHSAPISYTSVRSGLSRMGVSPELRIRDARGKLMPVVCACATGVTDGHRRFLRLHRLAVRAWSEALAQARLQAQDLGHTHIYLCLAEPERPGMDDRALTELVRKSCQALGLPDLSARTAVGQHGQAGPLMALQTAARAVASGACAQAFVAGVDSYLDELTLQWLHDTGRLKTDDNAKGFVPGEAAAFLLVERLSAAQARHVQPLAQVLGVGSAMESQTIYDKKPSTGEALTQAIRAARQTVPAGRVPSLVCCDLNGERYRAQEWGLVLSRALGQDAPGTLWHAADCMGDTGAASGALHLILGAMALARQHAGGDAALVWAASDDGERGAVMLGVCAPGSAT